MAHLSFHPECPETIVLIGGAGSDSTAFQHAIPYLSDYHILLPYSFSKPLTLLNISSELATLIHKKAKGGAAHIVGFSLGSHFAISLASQSPELVYTVFVTGFNRLTPNFASPVVPYAWYGIEKVMSTVIGSPGSKTVAPSSSSKDGKSEEQVVEQIRKDEGGGLTLSGAKETIAILSSWKELPKLDSRMLVVAATKGHFGLPTGDGLGSSQELFDAARQGNIQSRFAEAKGGRHAWSEEQPKDFADCVRAWVKGEKDLPDFLTPL